MLKWECWSESVEVRVLKWECWSECVEVNVLKLLFRRNDVEVSVVEVRESQLECRSKSVEVNLLKWECWSESVEVRVLKLEHWSQSVAVRVLKCYLNTAIVSHFLTYIYPRYCSHWLQEMERVPAHSFAALWVKSVIYSIEELQGWVVKDLLYRA